VRVDEPRKESLACQVDTLSAVSMSRDAARIIDENAGSGDEAAVLIEQ
jgi:hypothetical protein